MTTVMDVTTRTIGAIVRSLQTPLANRFSDLYHELEQSGLAEDQQRSAVGLTKLDCNPRSYEDPWVFKRDWLAVNILAKADFLPTGYDKKNLALAKWLDAEDTCLLINDLGRRYSELGVKRHEEAISLARNIIQKTLGTLDLDEWQSVMRFSGGASTSGKRRVGHPYFKYERQLDVTLQARALAVAAVKADQQWFYATVLTHGPDPTGWFRVVEGARWDTVPKNSKIDRVICIEPDMNMFLQKGLGKLIRQRLKRVGINLNSQWLNQHYAWIGSRTGSLATIDLSSASDTISMRIVRELLPPDWCRFIEMTRSGCCLMPDGSWHELEKVSSMGNGYTFELESLIFWALTKAMTSIVNCSDERVAVYGDDIVCHHEVAYPLCELLSYCGFTVNQEKSFLDGPFRESCGKHYFHGIDVTPFRVSARIDTLAQMFWLHNSYLSWVGSNQDPLCKYLATRIPARYRFRVPVEFGLKAGLHNPNCRVKRGTWIKRYQTHSFVYLAEVVRKHRPSGWASLHYTLGYYDASDSEFTLSNGNSKYAFKRAFGFNPQA